MITIQDLTTRELLQARDTYRNRYYTDEDEDQLLIGKRLVEGGNEEHVVGTMADIMAELNRRPHVSTKMEAKLIRRLRAQTGQTEEWLRAHPKYGQEIADAQRPNRQVIGASYAKTIAPLLGKFFGKMYKVKGK
jgi:hypothetical protein